MLHIDIISVVPDLLVSPFSHSILNRAKEKKLLEINVINLRDYAVNNHGQVDDYPFGGEAGMVLMIEPIDKCITELKMKRTYDEVIYTSPDAPVLNQQTANQLSLSQNLIILCGHYKGVDERVREHLITKEISIGDYVLSGGELAAAVIVDAIGRLIPGVIGDESSALFDSFQDGLLSHPVYTRPATYKNWEVPAILSSGHQKNIALWREAQALERTKTRRPDLLEDK
jgi:tRNA (guanine37-N1)-methyltransferase